MRGGHHLIAFAKGENHGTDGKVFVRCCWVQRQWAGARLGVMPLRYVSTLDGQHHDCLQQRRRHVDRGRQDHEVSSHRSGRSVDSARSAGHLCFTASQLLGRFRAPITSGSGRSTTRPVSTSRSSTSSTRNRKPTPLPVTGRRSPRPRSSPSSAAGSTSEQATGNPDIWYPCGTRGKEGSVHLDVTEVHDFLGVIPVQIAGKLLEDLALGSCR